MTKLLLWQVFIYSVSIMTFHLLVAGVLMGDCLPLEIKTKPLEYMTYDNLQRQYTFWEPTLVLYDHYSLPMMVNIWLLLVCTFFHEDIQSLLIMSFSFSEPIDFVHIYDTSSFQSSQVIDFFGEIAGVCKCDIELERYVLILIFIM